MNPFVKAKEYVDMHMRATKAKREGKLEEAEELISEAVKTQGCESSGDSKALEYSGHFLKGEILLEKGGEKDFSKSLEEFNKCLEIKPNDSKSHYMKGLGFKSLGKLEEAKNEFLVAVESTNLDDEITRIVEPFYELSRISRENGDLEKSAEYIDTALSVNPENVIFKCEKLLVSSQLSSSFDESLFEIDKIIDTNLKKEDVYAYPYYIKSVILQERQSYIEAVETLTKAFELNVEFRNIEEHHLYSLRSSYHFEIGNYKESLEDISKCREISDHQRRRNDLPSKKSYNYYNNNLIRESRCHVKLKNYDLALKTFEEAVEIFGSCNSSVHEYFGEYYLSMAEDDDENEMEYFKQSANKYFSAIEILLFVRNTSQSSSETSITFSSIDQLQRINEYFLLALGGMNIIMYYCSTTRKKGNNNIRTSVAGELIWFLCKELNLSIHQTDRYNQNILMYLSMNPNGINQRTIEEIITNNYNFKDSEEEEEEEEDTDYNMIHQTNHKSWNLAHFFVSNPRVTVENLQFLSQKLHLEDYEILEIDQNKRNIFHLFALNHYSSSKIKKDSALSSEVVGRYLLEFLKEREELKVLQDVDVDGKNILHYLYDCSDNDSSLNHHELIDLIENEFDNDEFNRMKNTVDRFGKTPSDYNRLKSEGIIIMKKKKNIKNRWLLWMILALIILVLCVIIGIVFL